MNPEGSSEGQNPPRLPSRLPTNPEVQEEILRAALAARDSRDGTVSGGGRALPGPPEAAQGGQRPRPMVPPRDAQAAPIRSSSSGNQPSSGMPAAANEGPRHRTAPAAGNGFPAGRNTVYFKALERSLNDAKQAAAIKKAETESEKLEEGTFGKGGKQRSTDRQGSGLGTAEGRQRIYRTVRTQVLDRLHGYQPRSVPGGAVCPQDKRPFASTLLVRAAVLLHIGASCVYFWWRIMNTLLNCPEDESCWFITYPDEPQKGWYWFVYAWGFFAVEFFLILGTWISNLQRLFPVERPVIRMDQLVQVDSTVAFKATTAILLPTAGEPLAVVMKALLGATSQEHWNTGSNTWSSHHRVVVLDEKRNKLLVMMVAAVHSLGVFLEDRPVTRMLQAEGLTRDELNPEGFHKWVNYAEGKYRTLLFPHLGNLELMVEIVSFLDNLTVAEDAQAALAILEHLPLLNARRDLVLADVVVKPGYHVTLSDAPQQSTLIYYTRSNNGMPKTSPKAGNMNHAIFPMEYPDQAPFIGRSEIVVVNDARHKLEPSFLQRTVPYFYQLDPAFNLYRWAEICLVQTPQRFKNFRHDDPLGNHSATQYDVFNHGKDGIGAVSSSGQGSLWRVKSLKGAPAPGRKRPYKIDEHDMDLVGHELGFRSEILIEDTHTSIDVFKQGWRSVYVNESDEVLAWCTMPPDSTKWRMKQLLRWHQGAAQLFIHKGLLYPLVGGFPTVFHRLYSFDQATYFFRAIPGYMLLFLPLIYGLTGVSPFQKQISVLEYIPYLSLVIVSGMLPMSIAARWKGISEDRLTRDEQTWLSTCHIQMYAFWDVLTSAGTNCVRCFGKQKSAWDTQAPRWPLFLAFLAQLIGILAAFWRVAQDGTSFVLNMAAILFSALYFIYMLWPMVGLSIGVQMPPFYFLQMGFWGLAFVVSGIYNIVDSTT